MQDHNLCPTLMPFFADVLFKAFQTTERCYRHRYFWLLSFTSAHTDAWRQQGYEDTMLAMEHIRKPLAARQALTRSEAVLQKSLDITEGADSALRNAMARLK